jgi:hypothetical protein
MYCIVNSKQIFPENKLRGLVPNFYIHVYVCEHLYIPTIGPQTLYCKIGGPIVGIYKSLTDTVHEFKNWERGRAVSFLGIFVLIFFGAVHGILLQEC